MRPTIMAFAFFLLLAARPLRAVDNVQISVSLLIAGDIAVHWCDAAGNNDTTSAQGWALGTVALSNTYTYTQGTPPTYQYLQNNSNTTIDVNLSCGNSTSWSKGAAAGQDTFAMAAMTGGAGGYTNLNGTWVDALDDIANGAYAQVELQIETPTSITIGGGVAQTITVTCTASIAN